MYSKMIEITTVIGCSLNCRYCPQTVLKEAYFHGESTFSGKRRPATMDLVSYEYLLDKIPTDYDIHFSGMSEAWINPALYTRM